MVNGGSRRLVADRYELLFELARGGMGVVHVARLVGAHGFDRLVAVKELLDGDDDPRAHASFLDEARVTAKIHHPNVLPTLELFEHDGRPFIVMELVRGVSVWQLLGRYQKAGEAPNVDLSAWIAMQAASGLHAAHELADAEGRPLGLVHRDVSPQNILLGFDGRVCVADFGIAKLRRVSLKTESGFVKGKFAYMSPEQARAQPLDRRSDIFSLGIVLHETLTGQRLFDHDSPTETLLHIIDQPIPSPRSIRPDVPEELSAIAMRCLAKAVGDRYETADALSRALRSALRARQSDADEQMLREVAARLLSDEQRRLDERLGSVTSSEDRAADTASAARSDTVVDASPPAFTEASVVLPLRRIPRAAWPSAIAIGLIVIGVGTYAAVRSSTSSRPEPSSSSGFASAPTAEPRVAIPSATSASSEPSATSATSVVLSPPPPAATSAPHAKKGVVAPKRPPTAGAAIPTATAAEAPTAHATGTPTQPPPTSKGVPFNEL